MDELITIDNTRMDKLIQIDAMSMDELQLLSEKIMAKKMVILQQKVEEAWSEIEKIKAKTNQIEEHHEKTLEIAVNSMRVRQAKYGYVNQGDFGRFFTVSIGSKTLGKLLKTVGLAMKMKGETTPYRDKIPKYAMTQAEEKYTSVKWNYEECLNWIDDWLKENGYYESFYSCKEQKELEKFINYMYENE